MNDIDSWYLYGMFAFFSTFSVYNGQRLIKSSYSIKTPWLMWVERNEKSLYLATFGSGLLTISCLLLIGRVTLGPVFLLIGSGIISLFYVIPVKGIVMREIPYIKVYLIAFTWAIVLIIFPMLNEDKFEWPVLLHALAHVLFIISAAIPFDIRDVKLDRDSHKTIPQVIGIPGAKLVSTVLLVLFLMIMLFFAPQLDFTIGFYGAVLVQFVLLVFMNEKRGDLYCAGAIDGAIGLVGLSYFFAQMPW